MSVLAQVLEQAIDVAENGFPLTGGLARSMASPKLAKYPSSHRLYQAKTHEEGEIFRKVIGWRFLFGNNNNFGRGGFNTSDLRSRLTPQ